MEERHDAIFHGLLRDCDNMETSPSQSKRDPADGQHSSNHTEGRAGGMRSDLDRPSPRHRGWRRQLGVGCVFNRIFRQGWFKAMTQLNLDGWPHGQRPCLPRSNDSRHKSRWSTLRSVTRRSLILSPVLVLMFLYVLAIDRNGRSTTDAADSGAIHILQVLFARARAVWDLDADGFFLPSWGQPGQPGAGLVEYPTEATRDVLPIPVHSHNDYWRRVPLLEALHYGCTSVEADVWLQSDDLFVGHTFASLSQNRTFQKMYVEPLNRLLDRTNPAKHSSDGTMNGVFDEDLSQTLVLLVDFKTDGVATFPYVYSQLEPLRSKNYLSYYNGDEFVLGPITVVGTGSTPFELVTKNASRRDILFDAPLDELWLPPQGSVTLQKRQDSSDSSTKLERLDSLAQTDSRILTNNTSAALDVANKYNATNSYFASVNFRRTLGVLWRGHLSARQMNIIRGQIRGARMRGLKARYWNTPAWPINVRNHIWHVLMKEGADILNADDLRAAAMEDWTITEHELW